MLIARFVLILARCSGNSVLHVDFICTASLLLPRGQYHNGCVEDSTVAGLLDTNIKAL